MIQKLKTNWLLVLAALLQAIFAAVNLVMLDPDGSAALRRLAVESTVLFQAKFALAAGACTIAAGVWSAMRGKSGEFWLLVLNGAALAAYALIPVLRTGPLHFSPYFALLLVAMAMSAGILALTAARVRTRSVEEWLLGLGGAALVGFALAFFAMDFRWIKLDQPGSYFVWLGAFFALSALCMLGLGLHRNGFQAGRQRTAGSALPAA